MTTKNIIRAWRDAEYTNSLSESEHASLPANPAGGIELAETDLNDVTGGASIPWTYRIFCTSIILC